MTLNFFGRGNNTRKGGKKRETFDCGFRIADFGLIERSACFDFGLRTVEAESVGDMEM